MNAKRKINNESDGCDDAKERAHKRQQLSSTKEKTEEKSVQPSLPPFKKEDDESEVPVLSKRGDAGDESEKDAEDESEKEESDLEEQCCDECGRYVDHPEEQLDEDGWCLECNKKMQVNNFRSYLPGGYDIREVSGSHRKPCWECGKNDWFYGDYYVFDASQPWGTAKYCLDCAETKFRYREESDEDDY